jgi:hypothetical protein
MKTQDYLIIGGALVGGALVFNKLFGKNAVAQTANDAGVAVGQAAGGAAGGVVTGVVEGAINAGKELAITLGFTGMSQSDADKAVNFDRQEAETLGTKGFFPNGEIFYTKNGIQTPSDQQFLAEHPEYGPKTAQPKIETPNTNTAVPISLTTGKVTLGKENYVTPVVVNAQVAGYHTTDSYGRAVSTPISSTAGKAIAVSNPVKPTNLANPVFNMATRQWQNGY